MFAVHLNSLRLSLSGNNFAEFRVGDEPALLGSELLHTCKNGRVFFDGDLDAQLFTLDGDTIETALFAKDDAARRPDEVGRDRINRLGGVKLDGDWYTFATASIFTDH